VVLVLTFGDMLPTCYGALPDAMEMMKINQGILPLKSSHAGTVSCSIAATRMHVACSRSARDQTCKHHGISQEHAASEMQTITLSIMVLLDWPA
jgi:predicted nucleic acid binding AN1-type Zn finger protein